VVRSAGRAGGAACCGSHQGAGVTRAPAIMRGRRDSGTSAQRQRARWQRDEVVRLCVGLCVASNGVVAAVDRVSILSGVMCSTACSSDGERARRVVLRWCPRACV
jgi:hypothetical protein